MASELLIPTARASDANGNPYAGATWTFYASGTSTPQNVYSNSTLVTSLGSTVTADSGGKFVPIYFDATLSYRGVCKDSSGAVTLHDIDPINSGILTTLAASGGSSLVGFLQAGTGATTRTAQAKLREVVSVLDFGADSTGSADSTSAFNAALATGNAVHVPAGTYKISSLTAIDADGAVIYGDGPDLTKIIQTSTTADLFTFGAGSVLRYSPSVSDMSFTVSATKTTGYLVKSNKTFGLKISNVRCDGYFGLVDLVTSQWTTIKDCHCVNMVATNGKAISARSGGSNLIVNNVAIDGGAGTQCYAGLYLEEWDGVFLSGGTQFNRCGNGAVFAPPSTKYCDHVFVSNVSFDTCSGVGLRFTNSGGSVRRMIFSAGWIGSCTNSGVQVDAGATVTGLTFDGWRIVNNGSYGIIFNVAVAGFSYTDGIISGNSASSSGTYSGIYLANGGTYNNLNISSTKIAPLEGFSNTQKYAIEVQAATGPAFSSCVIEGCDLSGNVTGAASWASADPRTIFMLNNTGYVTEASGSVTQSSAASTATVTHGLSITPVAGEIYITPHTDINTATRFWVSNLTSTTFQINTNANPASSVTWGWRAAIA